MWRQPPRLSRDGEARAASTTASLQPDASNKYFALDSSARILHSEITSQTSSAAGSAKLMFACRPCCRKCNSPDLVVSPLNLSKRNSVTAGVCELGHAINNRRFQ